MFFLLGGRGGGRGRLGFMAYGFVAAVSRGFGFGVHLGFTIAEFRVLSPVAKKY